MRFKDAFEHYQLGAATAEEAAYVEEELEKTQLIEAYLDADWDTDHSQMPPDYQKVRKKLRRSRLIFILIPILVIALVAALLPYSNAFFYDPTTQTYETFASDLDLYLTAYTELFHPGYVYYHTLVNRTGIGTYQLDLIRWGKNTGKQEYCSAAVEKGNATLSHDFLNSALSMNIIARASYPVYDMEPEHKAQIRQRLEQLPDYIEVTAALSFPEDHTIAWLLEFQEQLDGFVTWTGIRNAPEDQQRYPLCGMNLHTSGVVHEQINETYPAFETADLEQTPEMWVQHFESLLQYMVAHPEITDVMGLESTRYYEDVLAYVQETGVMSYGCVVTTTAQELLRLLDESIVTQVWPMDAEIKF